VVIPLSILGDRCPSRAAQGLVVILALAAPLAASCGENLPPRPASPRDAPARDVAVRTGRFAIHTNAYVDYYAWSREPGTRLDLDLVARLGACSDDMCAKDVLAVGKAGAEGLDAFLRESWTDHEQEARRTLGRVGSPLMDFEDVVAPTLATQIGRLWPDEPIVVYLARGADIDPSGREGPVIDTHGECFEDDALLECLLTRALEVQLPNSDLGRAIEEARVPLDERGRAATATAVPCVAALASDVAVAAATARYKPTRRFAEACPAALRKWLSDAWARRMHGDDTAKAFGAKLVEHIAESSSLRSPSH
jgi:hypothetical protein